MLRIVYLLVVLSFIASSIFGQEKSESFSSQSIVLIDSIPFVLTEHNNISIQAIINEVDTVQLMLHTAANSISVTEEGMKNITSIGLDGSENVKSWGGNSSSVFSANNSIRIGKIVDRNLTIWVSKNSGPNTDGKFGLDLFKDRIIELNFDRRMLYFYKEWSDSLASKYGYEKLEVTSDNGLLFVKGKSILGESQVVSKFLVHSGFGGSILFDDQTTDNYQLSSKLEIIKESQLKDSFGNILKTKKAILPDFILANQSFSNIPVGFFEGSIARQKMSVLGGDVLKRFNIIFDLKNTLIYLKPNSLMKSDYSDI